jgi:LysR family nitrogen assimilation transcriptional regulator
LRELGRRQQRGDLLEGCSALRHLLKRGKLTRKEFEGLPAAIVPLSRNPFPPTVPFSLRVDSAVPMKRIVASGLGYGLLPFSGIHEEIEAAKLSAALLPWMRADRVLALPRGRPVSRATRDVFTGLMQVCQDLIDARKILVAKPRKTSRRRIQALHILSLQTLVRS